MYADTIGVGVIDEAIRGRILDLVLQGVAKVSADRIGAVTIDEHAELGVGCRTRRARIRGEDQQRESQHCDWGGNNRFQSKWQRSGVAAIGANAQIWASRHRLRR